VDNLKTMAYGKPIEWNHRMLLAINEWCLKWAGRHRALFALK
jgi:hypothetical protein